MRTEGYRNRKCTGKDEELTSACLHRGARCSQRFCSRLWQCRFWFSYLGRRIHLHLPAWNWKNRCSGC